MVVGTRTTRQMIEQGTNMRGMVRGAHLLLAKLLEVLWWRFECRFTDVCCVYRGLWRSTYESIRSNLTATGVEVFPEMVIEVLRTRRRIIEVPVGGEPIKHYAMEVARAYQFRRGSGLFIKIPVIDMIEIGAGGGSIAEVDERGLLRVGPRSAGAMPGINDSCASIVLLNSPSHSMA